MTWNVPQVVVVQPVEILRTKCEKVKLGQLKRDNVQVIPDAGDVEIVGADIIAKLSA